MELYDALCSLCPQYKEYHIMMTLEEVFEVMEDAGENWSDDKIIQTAQDILENDYEVECNQDEYDEEDD